MPERRSPSASPRPSHGAARAELKRAAAARLFSPAHPLRAVIDGVLEAGLGSIRLDDPDNPRVARLSIGCYEIFGGDASGRAAVELAQDLPSPKELVYGNDPAWRRRLCDIYGARVKDRPMETFDPENVDLALLRAGARSLPVPYELRPLDELLLSQLDADLEPHALQVYPSPGAFLSRGAGFGAVADGVLACAATTYTATPRRAEIAIATRREHRGKGLAFATSARLMLHCLERRIEPLWNASNPVSKRLAVRLGFVPAGVCEVLYLS
jgi:GNAT superfamily N-acetyltransferase